MLLKIIGTGSSGNAYILDGGKECLLVECGVRAASIKQAFDFDVSKVVGAIVSHSHNDHAKAIPDIMAMGIPVYASEHTLEAKGRLYHHLANVIDKKSFTVGRFKIYAFDVNHDVPTLGFVIEHEQCGRTLFLTDTFYCNYTFPGLHNIIIEANYAKDIVDRKISDMMFLRDRVLQSHFSLDNCKDFLKANDLSAVNNIVLIHLSDTNSDEKRFKREVEELTGKTVHVAAKGLEIEFNKTPF